MKRVALDDDAGDAAGGDEAVAVAHRHPEREPAALDRLERRLGVHVPPTAVGARWSSCTW